VKLGALARAEDGLLGRGAQSQVLLYRHLDPPPGFRGMLQYGVKAIAKAGLSARAASRALEEKAALAAAAAAWAGRPGKSPIVRLCGTGQDETALYLITEFLSKGTLTELAPVPPSLARYYVGALAVALEQSHALGFVHRDIKLDNVLLDGDAVPRLIDFGLCRRLRRGERASSLVGTLGCAAPEVLAGLPYGHAAEWWSVGVALHHLLLGAPPFDPGAGPAMEPVSHFCACIGSLCLRQCVHGASIGRMGCAGQPRGAGELGGAHERWRACGDAGRQRAAHPARVRG
jgi:serine/threonine protein kinase